MQPTRFGGHATFFEVMSFDGAGEDKYEVKTKTWKGDRARTNTACIMDNLFRSSEPLLALALVDSVKSYLSTRK